MTWNGVTQTTQVLLQSEPSDGEGSEGVVSPQLGTGSLQPSAHQRAFAETAMIRAIALTLCTWDGILYQDSFRPT